MAQRAAVRVCTASLAADSLRPSAGGAPPPASRPLTSLCRFAGLTLSSLGSRQRLFRLSCARGPACAFAPARGRQPTSPGPRCARACLRRERRGDPRRLPSARGHGLATMVKDQTQTGSPAQCPSAPVRVLRWDPPPSAVVDLRLTLPRPARTPRGARAWDGKDAPHRLLQPTRDTCTCSDHSTPEVTASLSLG